MDEFRTNNARDTRILATAVLLVVGMCLACSLIACAVQALTPPPEQASDSIVAVCAWSRNGSMGLWWNDRRPPAQVFARASNYNARCALVPWSSALPDRGRPALDVSP